VLSSRRLSLEAARQAAGIDLHEVNQLIAQATEVIPADEVTVGHAHVHNIGRIDIPLPGVVGAKLW
jgi:hypothetical protein